MRKVLSQSKCLTTDWDVEKNIHSGKYGYLNIAVNHPEILRETKTIKQLVRSFNRSREKMWKYKDVILNYHVRKPDFMKCREPAHTAPQKGSPTMTRLIEKVSPYNEKDFLLCPSEVLRPSLLNRGFPCTKTQVFLYL